MPVDRPKRIKAASAGRVRVRGAREHNLKNVDLDIPRDAIVVFSGVSGSGKSSLAFGTLFAEAQRRYLESVSPYARRLIEQVGVPDVDLIEGLPPAIALQQQRGTPSVRSSVGSLSTLSNLLRMLYSRAGSYPHAQAMLYAEDFSPNTAQGACTECHGLGYVYAITEKLLVPDPTLSIRDRAIAAWPPAWHGQNLRDILTTLGYDVDRPWRELSRKDRHWILFTDDQPVVPVYPGFTPAETRTALKRKTEPAYMGTFMSARRYVQHTFAHTQSALMKRRAAKFMAGSLCPKCQGRRLKREALSVLFAGVDIGTLSQMPMDQVATVLEPAARGEFVKTMAVEAAQARKSGGRRKTGPHANAPDVHRTPQFSEEKRIAAQRLAHDIIERIDALQRLGLGYLTLDRPTPTLSPGELQRLRLATQIRSNLFGVVYVLDEPTAGLHPSDSEALYEALKALKSVGNSVFVVEHDLEMMRRADWLVDIGPDAGQQGGQVLYSGPPSGLAKVENSKTARYLFAKRAAVLAKPRAPNGWLQLVGVSRNNLKSLDAAIPLGVLTAITGVSGSGKSSLISQALVELVGAQLNQELEVDETTDNLGPQVLARTVGKITSGMEHVRRLVNIDQKPIGRTPRSNLATYTGLFDQVRKLFASTKQAKAKRFDAGRFSFNVAKGRCETCEGEGAVSIELLFMPSVYAPCPTCHGARYNAKTLEVMWQGKNIAQVLELTVDDALAFFAEEATLAHTLSVLRDIGLGYLRLGQPATELSGGEAQRVKLGTELQRSQRGDTLYVLDEPSTGLHPLDIDRLMVQLRDLVNAGNTVVVIEHEMGIVAQADWVIDLGPGAGEAGGRIVASGTPQKVAKNKGSRTAPYLLKEIGER